MVSTRLTGRHQHAHTHTRSRLRGPVKTKRGSASVNTGHCYGHSFPPRIFAPCGGSGLGEVMHWRRSQLVQLYEEPRARWAFLCYHAIITSAAQRGFPFLPPVFLQACGLLPRAARGRSVLATSLDKNSTPYFIDLQIKYGSDVCVCLLACELRFRFLNQVKTCVRGCVCHSSSQPLTLGYMCTQLGPIRRL